MVDENNHIETEILHLALDALKKNVPMDVEIKAEQKAEKTLRADFLLRMELQGRRARFHAEVKTNVTRPYIAVMLHRKQAYPHKILLVTRYVNGQMAEHLKENGIEFIDTAGNAYIHRPPLFIFIKGNKPVDHLPHIPHKRAFKPTGLRVVYVFLCTPGLENKPYRNIADAADVALGTVGWLMRELRELGYLLDMGKRGNKIVRKELLFQRWVAEYPEKLRPKQFLGRFRGDPGWWQKAELGHVHALWGGEVAAAKLTKYLKPQAVTLYTTRPHLNQLLLQYRLKKDINGDVEIIERFWKPTEQEQNQDMVHPILIYADLVATNNQRNMETAKVIYEQHILRLIRED